MNVQFRISSFIGIALLFAAASSAEKVKTDYDRGADFNHYNTSSWEKVQSYVAGTLVVDLFDWNTKKLIWRGSCSEAFSDKSGKNIKNLDKGVEKMFDRFPPDARRGQEN